MALLSPLSSERRFVNLLLMSYLILILRSLVNMLPDGDFKHPHDQSNLSIVGSMDLELSNQNLFLRR